MQQRPDSNIPKKPTNLSINGRLLEEARQLKINLSATLERALEKEVKEARRTRWLEQNKHKLHTCNKLSEKHGLFADNKRVF